MKNPICGETQNWTRLDEPALSRLVLHRSLDFIYLRNPGSFYLAPLELQTIGMTLLGIQDRLQPPHLKYSADQSNFHEPSS